MYTLRGMPLKRIFFTLPICFLLWCPPLFAGSPNVTAKSSIISANLNRANQAEPHRLAPIPVKNGAAKLPADESGGWWAAVQEDIRKSEYYIRWQEETNLADIKACYHAPNRAHNLRTYFTPEGIRVVPRSDKTSAWHWGLQLTGYGYTGNIQPVAAAQLKSSENLMEYARSELIEWYKNDRQGLEQGFTLSSAPKRLTIPNSPACNLNSEITLELSITGNVIPIVNENGSAVRFTAADGKVVIQYDKLCVFDATGRELPARFHLGNTSEKEAAPNCSPQPKFNDSNSTIRIVLDTTRAVYPIMIDPLVTSANWTAESNQTNARFGCSVSTAGDVNGDGYDDVIVGAYGYDNGQSNEGRAYVYHGSAAGLSTTPTWAAESNQAGAAFGYSVSTAGDVNGDGYDDVIIGASHYSNGQTYEGRVYVYHGSASGLSTSAVWTFESNQAGAWFGWSAGTAGDVNGDGYDDVVIGAYGYDGSLSDQGRAYVYHGSASGLVSTAAWTVQGDQAGAVVGSSVGTAGDVNGDGFSEVIIGAVHYTNGQTYEGRAYVYYGAASGLSPTPGWIAEGNQDRVRFGHSVGTAGDVNGDGYSDVIVGAPNYSNGESYEGRAYVYHGSPSGLSTTPAWTVESNQAIRYGTHFGDSVGTAGDVNGDGYSDVIVAAHLLFYPEYPNHEGRAYVYHGSVSGLGPTAAWTIEGFKAGLSEDRFSVSTAGDVNGDGFSEVIIGAVYYGNGQDKEGGAFAYYGPLGALGHQPPALNPIGNKTVNEGELLEFTITATDPENGSLTYAADNLPTGSAFNPGTRTFSWTPSAGQIGSHPNVLFTVTDDGLPPLSDSEAITIFVNGLPVAQDAAVTTYSDLAVSIALTATDANSDPLTLHTVEGPQNGTLVINGTSAAYYPDIGFSGQDAFTFKANDGLADSNIATVSVTLNPVQELALDVDMSTAKNHLFFPRRIEAEEFTLSGQGINVSAADLSQGVGVQLSNSSFLEFAVPFDTGSYILRTRYKPTADTGTSELVVLVNDQERSRIALAGSQDACYLKKIENLALANSDTVKLRLEGASGNTAIVDFAEFFPIESDAGTVTLTQNEGQPLLSGNQAALLIPAGIFAYWDTGITQVTLAGNAAAKVSPTVAYALDGKACVINVTQNFAAGDAVQISGLKLLAQDMPSGPGRLKLALNSDWTQVKPGGKVLCTAMGALKMGAKALLSGQSTQIGPVTIIEMIPSRIQKERGLKLVIPDDMPAIWDSSVTTLTLSGTAGEKISPQVSYSGNNKELVLTVKENFFFADSLKLSGLRAIASQDCLFKALRITDSRGNILAEQH